MRLTRMICAIGCVLGLAGPSLATEAAAVPAVREMVKVDPRMHYKVVYDIHSDEMAAGISKGLYYARGLIEAYGKQGVKSAQLDIHLVLHGDAAQYLLSTMRTRRRSTIRSQSISTPRSRRTC